MITTLFIKHWLFRYGIYWTSHKLWCDINLEKQSEKNDQDNDTQQVSNGYDKASSRDTLPGQP